MRAGKLLLTSLLALMLASPALAQQMQQPGGEPSADDQVDQLDQLVDLDDDQKTEIRQLLEEMQASIGEKEQEAQELQVQLSEQVGADYDEQTIRQDAERLGDLTGEMTADSILLQSKVEAVFTEEQRAKLDQQMEEQQRQMEQMQEQLQQQQGEGQGQQPAQ